MEQLASALVKAAQAGSPRADATFGPYASLFGFLHSSAMQEGRLLELAIADVAQTNPNLRILRPGTLPINPSALDMLERTSPEAVKGVRFSPHVYSDKGYKPDLFIVDQATHIGLLLDVKRNLGSHRGQDIEELSARMLAAAYSAGEWIAQRRGPVLVKVETAIIDGADELSDPDRGVFRLSEIDCLLGTEGAAESIYQTRVLFAEKVQAELHRRCCELVQNEDGRRGLTIVASSASEAHSGIRDARQTHDGTPRFGYARRPGLH